MKGLELKKVWAAILGPVVLSVGIFFGYEYVTEPKIVNGVVSKDMDEEGNPVGVTTVLSPEDTVYFSGKKNRFWIEEAEVVWYKGDIKTENRMVVEKEVASNKAGYFSSELSVPEGLEEGRYGVTIYVEGKKIIETKAEFDIKNK